jgi:hypothetical protein
MSRVREHAVLTALFSLSRIVLAAVGLPFSYRFDWLFFADPSDLRERLGETLVNFHLYPPGMNLCAGALLAAGGGEGSARLLYAFGGAVLVNALFYLLRALDTPALASFAVTLGFAMLPSTLYFEHSFTDTFPSAVLGTFAAALLHHAARRSTFASWLAFFSALSLLCLVRSSFHLAWFALLLAGALAFAPGRSRALLVKAALGPLLVVTLLYAKNLTLFGFFGPGSHTGLAYHALTNRVLSDEKAAFVRERRLSRLAALPVYAPPSAFAAYFSPPSWSPSRLLTDFERPTVQEPNYNHVFLLDAAGVHRTDARRAVLARPLSYAGDVLVTLATFAGPSTRYHPRDGAPDGPHAEHRRVLGSFESAVDTVMHRFPLRPAGLYMVLPLLLVWAAVRARALLAERHGPARPEAVLLALCVVQIGSVAAVAALSISTESARYRYAVEPLIWVVATLAVRRAVSELLPKATVEIPSASASR